jgi:LmbE family N-acetylglucosaminyl deacetylase
MKKSILIVAAHPDDEVLGCGGTIARHINMGDIVTVVFMTDGVSARLSSNNSEKTLRTMASKNAQEILGINEIIYCDFYDNRMDQVPLLNIVKKLEDIIETIKPGLVYTHYSEDLNIDHQITHRAVMTACRPLPECWVREIRCFEVISSTDWSSGNNNQFQPNLFVDIGEYLDKKLTAAEAYGMEMRAEPHSRSIDHVRILAKHRGYSVGLFAAEGFIITRSIL